MQENITVAKFGSELLVSDKGVDHDRINLYASGLAETHGKDGLVVVTSGAVAAGRMRLEQQGTDASDWSEVTLAQLGSASITHAWEHAFDRAGMNAGGLLTTHHEIEDKTEGPSLLRAMRLAIERRVVSIVNENDALSNTELMKLACGGDNDGLASHVSRAIGADTLKLFTKRGGVVDDAGTLIEEVNQKNYAEVRLMLDERVHGSTRTGSSGNGRGGMMSKLEAGWLAAQDGITTYISATNHDMTGDFTTRVVVG